MSSVRSQVWQLPAREFIAWLLVLFVIGCAAVWPHFGVQTASAEIRIQAAASTRAVDAPAWRLDVNRATQAQLECLPGIGPRRAAAILAERKKRGAFRDLWELCEVPGIPRGIVTRLEAMIQAGAAQRTESLVLPAKPLD